MKCQEHDPDVVKDYVGLDDGIAHSLLDTKELDNDD